MKSLKDCNFEKKFVVNGGGLHCLSFRPSLNLRSLLYSNLGLTDITHKTSKLSREDRTYLENPLKDSTTR